MKIQTYQLDNLNDILKQNKNKNIKDIKVIFDEKTNKNFWIEFNQKNYGKRSYYFNAKDLDTICLFYNNFIKEN